MPKDHRATPHMSGSAALFDALRKLGAKKGLDLSGTIDAAGRLWIEAQGETPPPPLPPALRGPKPKGKN